MTTDKLDTATSISVATGRTNHAQPGAINAPLIGAVDAGTDARAKARARAREIIAIQQSITAELLRDQEEGGLLNDAVYEEFSEWRIENAPELGAVVQTPEGAAIFAHALLGPDVAPLHPEDGRLSARDENLGHDSTVVFIVDSIVMSAAPRIAGGGAVAAMALFGIGVQKATEQ